jgi:hypothetical protein
MEEVLNSTAFNDIDRTTFTVSCIAGRGKPVVDMLQSVSALTLPVSGPQNDLNIGMDALPWRSLP